MLMRCKHCSSDDLESRGKSYKCRKCGKWTSKNYGEGQTGAKSSVKYGDDYIKIVCSSPRIITREDVIAHFQIDTSVWELKEFEVKTSEGYRKDREVQWDVDSGVVTYGHVRDSGKLLIAPMYHTYSRFVRKTEEIKATRVFESLVDNAKRFAPKYPKISYPKHQDGLLCEIALPDMQLGRMVMASVTDTVFDLTPEAVLQTADHIVDTLLCRARMFPVERFLFPVGNDFFDSDNVEMTTAHGTPQQDDPRWQKVFDAGKDFLVRAIDKMTVIAPVDVLVIPGNHDETKMFYLGSVLDAWYHANSNVRVNNEPKLRKYYAYGQNLIGLTHGYWEKWGKLDSLMAYEQPKMWAESCHREWHLGDRHHKVDMLLKTEELENGVVVRILRSLTPPSAWEYNKAFVGSLKAGEGFLWDKAQGVIAQFTAV